MDGSRRRTGSEENVEIEGTEPYIIGGHTASGYWVDKTHDDYRQVYMQPEMSLAECPQKYVTGALAEGEIAGEAILEYLNGKDDDRIAAENKEEALERGGEQELSQTAIVRRQNTNHI